ncbi:MAG TPA: site-specific integrase [Terriglobia bacterium]|nr:site-specific integrase [Terriglobia bacterium]
MQKASLKKKNRVWIRKADGVYLHSPSGFYYWRPWRFINGRMIRTWESLDTTSLKIAQERYAKLRYPSEGNAPVPSNGAPAPLPEVITMGRVIRHYRDSKYPDKHKQPRKGQNLTDEESHCETLLKFWDTVPVDQSGPASCDRYYEWRKKEGFNKGCTGERMVDRELNTLNNACRWAARCELIKTNPMRDRPKYQKSTDVKHCLEFMPRSADELHEAAALLFQHPHTVVLGFQMLSEAYTGLRTIEVLKWGEDHFGTVITGGEFMNVWRCKGQHANNPYSKVHPGLKALLEAHAAWKAENYTDRKEFFPSHCGGTVDKGSLAHALRRIRKQLKRKLTSHGMRAFYVLIRRSQGASDEQIADEIGHSSNGACIKTTYGGSPEEWRNGKAPNFSWLPANVPVAWSELEKNGWKFPKPEPEPAN